ncbi:MAG: LysM peptidoglycan-binding domain-containing protein, partial [Myxococcota bacterium]
MPIRHDHAMRLSCAMASSTVTYTAKYGDFLVKVAEAHGTTWQAIWTHPDNAEHRRKRRSPDALYPGDVLSIPCASPEEGPTSVPGAGPPAPSTPGDVRPWPYPPAPLPTTSFPGWDCPDGTCACHPPDEYAPLVNHTITLFDPQGVRLSLARVRVLEAGREITDAMTQANPQGEVTLKIKATTTSLVVEWAPPELPEAPFLPYRKRYHVKLGERPRRATQLRFANLGVSNARSLPRNVSAYRQAVGQLTEDKNHRSDEQIATHHDRGLLPPFVAHHIDGTGRTPTETFPFFSGADAPPAATGADAPPTATYFTTPE